MTTRYGTTYSVWLLSPTGQYQALITRFTRLHYTLATNGIGVLDLVAPPSFPMSYIQEDSRLLIYRQVAGGGKYLDGDAVWLIRDWEESIDAGGKKQYTMLAYSGNDILNRPIIAYSQFSGQAAKASTYLDNTIKAFIRENLGSLATDTARNISSWLTVESNVSAGPSAPKTAPLRQLLPTLREIAQTADNLGTPVFFDVIYNGGAALLARTYTQQRGVNHGSGSGQPVILSTRNGTIAEIKRAYSSADERNVIYLNGPGSTQIDSIRTGISPYNRREFLLDSGGAAGAALTAEGQAALKQYRPRVTYTAKIRDTEGIRYGREYGYGDRLTVETETWSAEARLDSVEITVEAGRESIDVELRVEL